MEKNTRALIFSIVFFVSQFAFGDASDSLKTLTARCAKFKPNCLSRSSLSTKTELDNSLLSRFNRQISQFNKFLSTDKEFICKTADFQCNYLDKMPVKEKNVSSASNCHNSTARDLGVILHYVDPLSSISSALDGYGGSDVQYLYEMRTLDSVLGVQHVFDSKDDNVFFNALETLAIARYRLAQDTSTSDWFHFGQWRTDVAHTPVAESYAFKLEAWERLNIELENQTISYEKIPLTSFENGRYKSGYAPSMVHTPPENIGPMLDKYIQPLFERILRETYKNENQLANDLGRLHWMLAQTMPFSRGSAAISENLINALLIHKGYYPQKFNKMPDLEAIFEPDVDAFSKKYVGLFKKPLSLVPCDQNARASDYPIMVINKFSPEAEKHKIPSRFFEGGDIYKIGNLFWSASSNRDFRDKKQAVDWCKDIGGDLPSKEDYERLVQILTLGKNQKYTPTIMFGLARNFYWTNSRMHFTATIDYDEGEEDVIFAGLDGIFRRNVRWENHAKCTYKVQ